MTDSYINGKKLRCHIHDDEIWTMKGTSKDKDIIWLMCPSCSGERTMNEMALKTGDVRWIVHRDKRRRTFLQRATRGT